MARRWQSAGMPSRPASPVVVVVLAAVGALLAGVAGTGAYLWQPSLQAGQPDLLLGRPVYTDPNSPAIGTGLKSVAFIRPTSYGIASYNAVRVDIDRSFKFDTDQVAVRVVQHVDGAVLQPACVLGYVQEILNRAKRWETK